MFRIYTGRTKVESGHQTESVDSLLEREFERCILPLSDQCILSILATDIELKETILFIVGGLVAVCIPCSSLQSESYIFSGIHFLYRHSTTVHPDSTVVFWTSHDAMTSYLLNRMMHNDDRGLVLNSTASGDASHCYQQAGISAAFLLEEKNRPQLFICVVVFDCVEYTGK